jgi:hypothetical protein
VRGELEDVSASSGTDAWAVGGSLDHTLAEHWNGSSWRRLPTPNPGRHGNVLLAVVAITPSDAWAVGAYGQLERGEMLLHWNGSTWQRRLLPSGAEKASLTDMAATSPSNVWAVGGSRQERPRIVHYNGSQWTIVPDGSSVTAFHVLTGVAATSPSDAWAVGQNPGLAEHWDGHTWRETPLATGDLLGVAATGAGDAWAIGEGATSGGAISHWNGAAWSAVATPSADEFVSVAAASSTDAWAIGSSANHSVLDHWNGSTWAQGPSLSVRKDLASITNVPMTTTYWAVGHISHIVLGGGHSTQLIESHC